MSTPTIEGAFRLSSAAELLSIGSIEMIVSEGSGSAGSAGEVSGVCRPMGWSGSRSVPLFGLGVSLRESQIIL